ncbi:hypothetical protein B4U84_29165 [Westiellopsis prolifica IICB1]|nr:hypothetical protein B4U84_29165 [Westiellopsis prolifica IICB1]
MTEDSSKVDEALNASKHLARTSLERIRFNTAATAEAIENINRNLDAIEQRRLRSTQKENELVTEEVVASEFVSEEVVASKLVCEEVVSEEFITEELSNTSFQVQFERTQTVAPIVAGILKVVEKNRFEGDKHTVYWDELDQLVLVRNSDGAQLMKASYNSENSQWEPVEPSLLTSEEVQHFQQLIPKIQPGLQHLKEEKERVQNRNSGLSL